MTDTPAMGGGRKKGRKRTSFCHVRVNQHAMIYFEITWDKTWKESSGYPASAENLERAKRFADKVHEDIATGRFSGSRYLMRFPEGNRVAEFRAPAPTPSLKRDTVEGFFDAWIKTLGTPKVRRATARQYRSSIRKHVIPTMGKRRLSELRWQDLALLQDLLQQQQVGTAAINRALHHAFRSMVRDAVRSGISVDPGLYDRRLWRRLPEDTGDPDPYTPEERDKILEHFRGTHWFAFVYFAVWQGTRPGEAIALRRLDLDLDRGTALIRRSRVYTSEAATKTRKSKRTIRLHPGTIRVVRSVWPIHTKPDDYVFTTPGGSPINEQNFQQRIWSPALRRLGLRDRGFYACRSTYCSTMISLGKKVGFIAEQTGHSIRTLEARYAKYFPAADDLEIPGEDLVETSERGISSTFSLHPEAKVERKGGG